MTFCCAIKVDEGLVALADTRILSGSESTTAHKISVHQYGRHSLFLMTSGLRAVRDKAVTYFEEALESANGECDKLYKAVNQLATQLRRVAAEDKSSLKESGLVFDLHAIVGGQLERDREPKLYLLYPQGNWVEVSQGSPYLIIGESGYGKPFLDWGLRRQADLAAALKVGFLAFDATRTSAVNVDFPLDVLLYRRDSYVMVEHRYERSELAHLTQWWRETLWNSMSQIPSDWITLALAKLPPPDAVVPPPGAPAAGPDRRPKAPLKSSRA